jgi:hypothetical protein
MSASGCAVRPVLSVVVAMRPPSLGGDASVRYRSIRGRYVPHPSADGCREPSMSTGGRWRQSVSRPAPCCVRARTLRLCLWTKHPSACKPSKRTSAASAGITASSRFFSCWPGALRRPIRSYRHQVSGQPKAAGAPEGMMILMEHRRAWGGGRTCLFTEQANESPPRWPAGKV